MKHFRTCRSVFLCLIAALLGGAVFGCGSAQPIDAPQTSGVTSSPGMSAAAPAATTAVSGDDMPPWYRDSMVLDIDGDFPAIYMDRSSGEAMLAGLDNYFDRVLSGTAITDVVLNCFEQNSLVPSETVDWAHKRMAERVAESGPVPGFESLSESWSELYAALTETGIDWFQESIDRCRAHGVRPWMYLRMNDRHNITQDVSPFHDRFFFEAREKGYLIGHSEIYGADIANQYDYASPEVRAWMLSYIEEQLNRYDVFGLELDFMRCAECFDYVNHPDCAEIMTGFLAEVRALLDRAAAIRGHELRLMTRVNSSIDDCRIYGFDAAAWAQRGLVDAIVPTGYYGTADSEIDVRAWRACVGENVAVIPGFDSRIFDGYDMTAEHVRGYAAGYYADGADGLYFENYYQLGSQGPNVWGITRDNVTDGQRTYVVIGHSAVPVGGTVIAPFPVTLYRGDCAAGVDVTLSMGEIRADDTVTVLIGLNAHADSPAPALTLNGTAPSGVAVAEFRDNGVDGKYLRADPTGVSVARARRLVACTFTGVTTDNALTLHFAPTDENMYLCHISVTVDEE